VAEFLVLNIDLMAHFEHFLKLLFVFFAQVFIAFLLAQQHLDQLTVTALVVSEGSLSLISEFFPQGQGVEFDAVDQFCVVPFLALFLEDLLNVSFIGICFRLQFKTVAIITVRSQ
jgi:hypothetical protein